MEKLLVKLIAIILEFAIEYFWETGSDPSVHEITTLGKEMLNGTNKAVEETKRCNFGPL
jgi:hypothetical protein